MNRDSAPGRGLAHAAAALILLWAAACGDGTTEPPPAPNRAPAPSGSIPPETVAAGETVAVNMASYFADPDGDPLTYAAASSNAATASVSVSGSVVTVTAVARGEVAVTVTARDPGGLSAQHVFTVTVPNQGPVAADTVPAQTVFAGETVVVELSGYFNDPDGDALTHEAESASADVATVEVAGTAMTIAGAAPGATSVTVIAADPAGLSAQQTVGVTVPNRGPVAAGTIPAQSVERGETVAVDVSAAFSDPDGETLSYAAASSNTGVATVAAADGSMTVSGVEVGTVTITVTATDPGQLSAQQRFPATVTGSKPGAPLVISGVRPSVLVEGGSATISGSGFSATAAENRVSVGGAAATVTSASPTNLSITVPRADCLPPRRAELRVSVESRSDARTVGVTPLSREDMDLPANWYRYSTPGDGCVHLPGGASGAEYLIGVVSTSEAPSSLAPVTLSGTPGDVTIVTAASQTIASAGGGTGFVRKAPFESLAAGGAAARTPPSADARFEALRLGADSLRVRRIAAQNEMMARNQALLRELGRSSLPRVAADQSRQLAAGDTITLYAEYADSRWSCSDARQVTAEVRLVGNHTIWLDDVANPSGTFANSEFAELDAFYGTNIKSVLDSYFGGLSDVDGNGRVLILMTQEVNRAENTAGYVFPGDLYSSAGCATSNHAEIFYGQVPDPAGVVGDPWTKEQVLAEYPSLIAHEITHVVQSGAQVLSTAGRKTSWEMEAGATLAEQLVSHRLSGHGSGRDLGYAEYSASRAWHWKWVEGMSLFFGWDPEERGGRVRYAPEQCSWVGTPDEGNSGPCKRPYLAVYGVPSMVFRYAMDRWGGDYPGGEEALMRRLTQSPMTGFASLEDVSSWESEQILADFYITLWMDLNGYGTYGMTSWDLRDVFSRLPAEAQLRPYTSNSTQPRVSASVRAGSSLYLHWTPIGSLSPTAIKVTSASGGSVPGHMSVWALRIR